MTEDEKIINCSDNEDKLNGFSINKFGFSGESLMNNIYVSHYKGTYKSEEINPDLFTKVNETPEAIPIDSLRPKNINKSICGNDDRIVESNTLLYPLRATCYLYIKWKDGTASRCTGFLISKDIVATCGHCMYNDEKGGFADYIDVYPGRDGQNSNFGYYRSKLFYTVRGWTEYGKKEWDFGAIRLSQSIGNYVGYYGFGYFEDSVINIMNIKTHGYPGDKPKKLITAQGNSDSSILNSKEIYYSIDTVGGQSGSPIYSSYNSDDYLVLGVHGWGGCPNSARRIDKKDLFNYYRALTMR